MSPRQDMIFLFGDLTGNILPSIRELSKLAPRYNSLSNFLRRSIIRLHKAIEKTPDEELRQYLHFQSPLELALALASSKDIGSSAVAATLLFIVQLADFIVYLETNPRALYASPSSHIVMAATGTGMLTAAVASCSSNLTELVSLADEVVEVAFRLGWVADRRSEKIEPWPPSLSRGYNWATMVRNVDVAKVQKTLENLGGPRHTQAYVSAVGISCLTISAPPSTTNRLFLQDPLLLGCEKGPLPIRAAFHAPHLDPIPLHQLMHGTTLALQKRNVEHPLIISSATGEVYQSKYFSELLGEVCQDILSLPTSSVAILQGLSGLVAPRASCVLFGPGSITSPIRPFLTQHMVARFEQAGQDVVHQSASSDHHSQAGVQSLTTADPHDIAIVGMGVRLPGCESLEEFWQVLEDGRDLHERIRSDRFDLATHFDPSGTEKNTTKAPYGVFIDRPGFFDRHLFKMSPREALQTDPQQRLLLLATYEALEMAGYSAEISGGAGRQRRIGSFIGQTSDDWREVNSSQDIDTYFIPGGMRAFGPGKLHYHFGWEGPSYSVDTACSSSTAAIQLAVSSLLAGECDMAIGGGVNFLSAPDVFSGLSRGGFLSSTGGCKTFDDEADGYCRADAVGVVVLKRLSDALTDRDSVFAVLRGAMTNHSAEAISITHPHAETQGRLFSSVLAKSGLLPSDIDYVEMHGTGTQAGDATEMTSVTNVLSRGCRTSANPLYVGSVKPNLGHGEAGSGVSSLIKAVMMLRKNIIAPHVGIKGRINRNLPPMAEVHTHLSLEKTPFLPRQGGDGLRRILVNNFDAAGGNTSMVIQDPPSLVVSGVDPRTCHVVVISGKTEKAALGNAKRLLDYLKQHPETRIEDLSYTTTARRMQQYAFHRAYAESSIDGLCRKLEETICNNVLPTLSVTMEFPLKIFVFTGQGSQYASMASELFLTNVPFHDYLVGLAEICTSHGFPSFLPLITDPGIHLSEALPVQTQTAIVAIELAITSLWKDLGVTPDVVIGHSLGEFAALCTAGVISVSNCLYLVGRRATLMVEKCTPGTHTMLAIHENLEKASEYLTLESHQTGTKASQDTIQRCEIACINGVKSTVVSGPMKQIAKFQQQLQTCGVKSTLLNLPYAFHSSQMDPILDDFEKEAARVTFLPPKIPFASTCLGTLVSEDGIIDAGYLRRQTRGCVQFMQAIDALKESTSLSHGRRHVWIETGPHPTCIDLIRPGLTANDDSILVPLLRRHESDWKTLARALATTYEAGVQINWKAYHAPYEMALQLLELPRYAFDLKNYWIQYEGDWSVKKNRLTTNTCSCSTENPLERPFDTASLHRIHAEVVGAEEVSVTFVSDVSDPRLAPVLSGHRVNGHKLCPSSLYAEMAFTAARYTYGLGTSLQSTALCMDIRDMDVHRPLIIEEDTQKIVTTAYQRNGSDTVRIHFNSQDEKGLHEHANCQVVFGDGDGWSREWARHSYLIQARMDHLVSSSLTGTAHKILGSMFYKLFQALVDYNPQYQGIQTTYMDSQMQEATAMIQLPAQTNGSFSYHPYLIDSMGHISGFVLNGSDVNPSDTVYISHGWKSLKIAAAELLPERTYHSYVRMQQDPKSPGLMAGDVYVFEDGKIIALFQEIRFRRIKRSQLEHFLPAIRPQDIDNGKERDENLSRIPNPIASWGPPQVAPEPVRRMAIKAPSSLSNQMDLVLAHIAQEIGVDVSELQDRTGLADIGVDSLLSITLASSVSNIVGHAVPSSLFLESVTVDDLCESLAKHCGMDMGAHKDNASAQSSQLSDSCSLDVDTPDTGSEMNQQELQRMEQGFPPNSPDQDLQILYPTAALGKNKDGNLAKSLGLSRSTSNAGTQAHGSQSFNPNPQDHITSTSETRNHLHQAPARAFPTPSARAVLLQGSSRPGAGKQALFLLPDGSGRAGSYAWLPAMNLEAIGISAVYGLNSPFLGADMASHYDVPLGDVVHAFLCAIQAIQPHGPYHLGGWSIGGVYAFEVAAQLHDVASLFLIDPPCPQQIGGGEMYGFEPATQLEDVASLLLRGSKLAEKVLLADDGTQAHFAGSMKALGAYRGAPVCLPGLRVTLVWAKQGVWETMGEEAEASLRTNGGSCSNSASDWIMKEREDYGPHGWDLLLPGVYVACHVVDGDHFTMMKRPAICEVGRLLEDSLTRR